MSRNTSRRIKGSSPIILSVKKPISLEHATNLLLPLWLSLDYTLDGKCTANFFDQQVLALNMTMKMHDFIPNPILDIGLMAAYSQILDRMRGNWLKNNAWGELSQEDRNCLIRTVFHIDRIWRLQHLSEILRAFNLCVPDAGKFVPQKKKKPATSERLPAGCMH